MVEGQGSLLDSEYRYDPIAYVSSWYVKRKMCMRCGTSKIQHLDHVARQRKRWSSSARQLNESSSARGETDSVDSETASFLVWVETGATLVGETKAEPAPSSGTASWAATRSSELTYYYLKLGVPQYGDEVAQAANARNLVR